MGSDLIESTADAATERFRPHRIWALGDPHLSLGTPGKEMDVFGDAWTDHAERIATAWKSCVSEDDLVLVPGDISWALKLDAARPDLEHLAGLPGEKVLIRGNHDYWWSSRAKVRRALPARMHALDGDALRFDGVVVAGTRLWDVPGVPLGHLFPPPEEGGPPRTKDPEAIARDEKIYARELGRLDRALEELDSLAEADDLRLVMIHYPPTTSPPSENELTDRFERFGIDHVVFGHLHALRPDLDERPFGALNGVEYHLTACDFLDFTPKPIGPALEPPGSE